MASALAVLADDNVVHGPLEVLLTMTEEAGMDGAFGLQSGWLQADILINTDSEEEGEIYMGCAGGIDFTSNLPLTREAVPAGFACFKLTLKGLKGGHSGGEIHLGLGNANKLLARFLAGHAEELDLRLIDFNGGTLRNAIPREAFATLAVATDNVGALKTLVNAYQDILKNELAEKEKNLTLQLNEVASDKAALTAPSRDTFVRLLNATPNGVIRNSDVAKGVVETSLNVGVVTMSDANVEIHCLIRSLIDSGKDYVVSMLDSLGKLAGAKTEAKAAILAGSPMRTRRSCTWCGKPISVCSTRHRTSRLSTPAWNAVCLRNPIRIWTWFLLGLPLPDLTLRMSRYISKASATTGLC